ncbi:ATP-binding protein [Pedobacter sp. AW31-3R]|uniref:ATP-binding protein n=1 Tax=Pedobacter sp. AW31-3R TaxID=3445781 RepID=UPI003F9FD9CC
MEKDNLNLSFLTGGGETGRLLRNYDWSTSVLGEPNLWPQSLKTSVSIILHSKYPMFLWWGRDTIINIHNDAYIPLMGVKHPRFLVEPANELWAEIWETDLLPMKNMVFDQTESIYGQDLMLILERKGFREEGYYNFSYSPIIIENGEVGGLFCACHEETKKVLQQRRMQMSTEINTASWMADSINEVLDATFGIIEKNFKDIPFCALYLLDPEGRVMLRKSTSLFQGHEEFPLYYDLKNGDDFWNFERVIETSMPAFIEGVSKKITSLHHTLLGDIPQNAVCMPVFRPADNHAIGIMVFGISPNLVFDNNYQQFFQLIASKISLIMGAINAREQEKNVIRASEENLNNILLQAPVAISIFKGPDLTVELVNDKALSMWDRTRQQVKDKHFAQVFPEVENQGTIKPLQQVYHTGVAFVANESQVNLFRQGKISPAYFNFVYEPLRDINHQVTGVVTVGFEVTDQVVARKKAEESEHRLNMALDYTNTASWELDLHTKDLICTQQMALLFGFKASETLSFSTLRKRIHPEDLVNIVEKAFQVAMLTGDYRYDARFIMPDGSIKWVYTQGKVIFDENFSPVRMIGTVKDITEAKNEQNRKDEFMGVIAHELKTPVTSVKAFAQFLEERFNKSGDTGSAQMLGKMGNQINKLTLLIQDLVDLTMIEGSVLKLHQQEFDFMLLIKDTVEELQRTTTKRIIILSDLSEFLICADKDRTGQVLINLLSNAIKYSPEADQIEVSSYIGNETLICSVRDFGIGIATEKQTHLFERFYRVLENERSNSFPGLGLGLYISAEIIRRQNGAMWLESEKGKGSVFYFSLPLIK